MADEQISIDEAVSTISALEKEERRKWNAIQRIKGVLLVSQSLRGKEAALSERASKYASEELDIEQRHKKRMDDIESAIKKADDDHKAYIELLTGERQRVEKESRESIEKAKQSHISAMNEFAAAKKRTQESHEKDIEIHSANMKKMKDDYAALEKTLKSEEATLSEKVRALRSELSRIQDMMMGVLKKGA